MTNKRVYGVRVVQRKLNKGLLSVHCALLYPFHRLNALWGV